MTIADDVAAAAFFKAVATLVNIVAVGVAVAVAVGVAVAAGVDVAVDAVAAIVDNTFLFFQDSTFKAKTTTRKRAKFLSTAIY